MNSLFFRSRKCNGAIKRLCENKKSTTDLHGIARIYNRLVEECAVLLKNILLFYKNSVKLRVSPWLKCFFTQPLNRVATFTTSSSFVFLFLISILLENGIAQLETSQHLKEKTCFQTAAPWKAEYDVRADIAIVYGMTDTFTERVRHWKDRGYGIHFMTGIAWGSYQDYFTGKFDGQTHMEDGQVDRDGNTIWHHPDVPYVVPSKPYLIYIKSLVKKAIDGGVAAIHLEEPEFWARAGYSASFKNEWQRFYNSPWMPQHQSPEATYLSSKLKYNLYFEALKEVFLYAKNYSESQGKRVKAYVPTHSLINYSAWRIVSPEASLAALPGMDGYIAQVWTGTSRTPTYFNGVIKERVFENAYLEYGSMISMTEPTGRKMFFLTDPVEDRARTWEDYKRNYQATFIAQLMYPMVDNYEVMPWPTRIYLGKFKMENNEEKQGISRPYATQMQVMINSLNTMPPSETTINGTQGIGVLLSNSMMFQRFPTHKEYEDPRLSNFYGMVMPLIKRGVPVKTVHMENLHFTTSLKGIKVLIMSYANMKPLSAGYHLKLAEWVESGGVLIYYGRDNDPFQEVREWWNSDGNYYKAPSDHLFEQMTIKPMEGQQNYSYGKGRVYILRQDPKELILQSGKDLAFINLVKQAYETDASAGQIEFKNNFYLRRGPYDIIAVLDESDNAGPLEIKGPVIDLFDPELPVLTKKTVQPGEQAYLYNLKRVSNSKIPKVLCAASRTYEESISEKGFSFISKSPSGTWNVMRILLPVKPKKVSITDHQMKNEEQVSMEWDEQSSTCLIKFENSSEGHRVDIEW